MNLYTDHEYHVQSQHFAFRLRNLYLNDRAAFDQIQDYLPFPIYINHRVTARYTYFNDLIFSYGREIELLFQDGKKYLPSISDPYLMKRSFQKTKIFHLVDDYSGVCNYLQSISFNGQMTPFFTNKILLDEEYTLNVSSFMSKHDAVGKIFKDIIPWGTKNFEIWQRFQTLTKREKEIMKLISNGKDSREISEVLILSIHSVATHRRNIFKKLDVQKTAQLVKYSLALELL